MEPPPPIPGEAAAPAPAPNGNGAKPAGPQVTLPGGGAPSAMPTPPSLPAASQVAELPPVPKPRDPEQAPTFSGLPSRFEKSKPLGEAPLPALVKQTRMGLLPVTAPDGRQSWQAYARPFSGSADKPKVGAVVTDLGLNKDATEAAIARLPPDVTLAFSPYAGGLDKWFKKARDAGHEVMLQLPSEPMSFPAQDPGPLALLTTLSAEENGQRLETVLSRAAGYVGVIGTGGRLATSDHMAPVLQALKERGLLYVGDGADRDGAPPSTPGLVADQEPFRDAIDMRLGQVAAQARRGGGALAVVSARPVSLDRLVAFLSGLSDQGLQSAPASAIVKPRAAKP
jgi:hypothetical protein